jgi:hypothetical protein
MPFHTSKAMHRGRLMDAIDLFTQRLNLLRLTRAYRDATDAIQRQIIKATLINEEDKFGYHREQLDMANENIVSSRNAICRQEDVINRLADMKVDTTLARETLDRLEEAHHLHLHFYRRVVDRVARNGKVGC